MPDLTSVEIRQQILDRIDTSPRALWIRSAYDLGHLDGEIAERRRILEVIAYHRDAHHGIDCLVADLLDGTDA